MKVEEIRDRIVEKLDELSPQQLNSILQYLEFLQYQQSLSGNEQTAEESRVLAAMFRKLCQTTQVLHADQPLTEEEIQAEIDAYRCEN